MTLAGIPSTLSIYRGVQLYSKIAVYSGDHRDEFGEDFLLANDWDVLKWMAQSLCLFWETTLRLQSKARFGHHRAIWETLPAIGCLLRHLERAKAAIDDADEQFSECTNNLRSNLKHYYDLTKSLPVCSLSMPH